MDVGGTFSDAVGWDGREFRTAKVLTTPTNPVDGVTEGIDALGVAALPAGRYGRTAFCPWRAESTERVSTRAASWGAWKPMEFSASMKSRRNWAFRCIWRATVNWSSVAPVARAALSPSMA